MPSISEEKDRSGRTAVVLTMLVVAVAVFVYLGLVIGGRVPTGNRLGAVEVGLAFVACLFLTLAVYPDALSRISLLKLPGGVEVTLSQIQEQQAKQRQELDAFFRILTNLLSMPEKYHLRALARGGEKYVGRPPLRDELLRLIRYGLIEEIPGQNVGDIHDGREVDIATFVKLTSSGENFIRALGIIEAH